LLVLAAFLKIKQQIDLYSLALEVQTLSLVLNDVRGRLSQLENSTSKRFLATVDGGHLLHRCLFTIAASNTANATECFPGPDFKPAWHSLALPD
jgi:hypothetical protein